MDEFVVVVVVGVENYQFEGDSDGFSEFCGRED